MAGTPAHKSATSTPRRASGLPQVVAALIAAVLTAGPLLADCSLTSTGLIPLPDLGPGLYLGQYQGGLYPGGTSIRPKKLRKASKKRMNAIEPLDRHGNSDPDNGAILFLSIGVSNTKIEFSNFEARAEADASVNPQVVMFNAAQGGTPADLWVDPNGQPWANIERVIGKSGHTPAQVQVVWMKHAHRQPFLNGPFPTHAQVFQADLEAIARALKFNYPNIQLVYLSSRTRAYSESLDEKSPEPYAYESGFGVKWAIEKQLDGDPDLSHDADTGPAPLLLWGPYIWADGTRGRSDGFVWKCQDTRTNEFIHPSESGAQKIGDQLMAFFKTHPTSRKWFLKGGQGAKPNVTLTVSAKRGSAPHTVELGAKATVLGSAKKVRDYSWTFDDGTFSTSPNPTKVFAHPGTYKIWLTVTDDLGNARSKKKKIKVTQ